MTALFYGLQVMVVGMLIVFSGLIILIGCIKAMERVMERLAQNGGKINPASLFNQKTPENPNEAAQPAATANDDSELVAVITAAIAAMLEQETAAQGEAPEEEVKGFVVRSIRRVSNASAWNRAGREEQIYSRL